MKNKILLGVLVVAMIAIVAYLLSAGGPVVSAQGYSSIKVQPDQVSVVVSIETRNISAKSAQQQNDEINKKLMEGLSKLGIKDVQLSNFNVYPDYDWSNGKQKELGTVAVREIIVKTVEFEQTAEIVEAVIDSGARVSYINFELSQERQNEFKAKALEEASKDAKVKAKSIAAGQGKGIGSLISLTNNEFNYPGPVMYYSKAEASADNGLEAERAAVNISPREMEISASVSAQYKMSRF